MTMGEFLAWFNPLYPRDTTSMKFQGIKWQEEHHPSAEKFPIDIFKVEQSGKNCITVTFITKPHKSNETK